MTLRFGAGARRRGRSRENWASRTARCASIWPSDRSRWDHLAAAGRTHRPGNAGTAIVRQWRCAGRSTPSRGAGLGGGRAEAEAPRRQLDDPMGRISGGSFWMATPTADIANCSGSSSTDCRPACDRPMSPATRLSSTSRARRSQSSMRRPAWCARREIFVSVLGASNLHLCGGNLDAGLTGLDWRACADVPVLGCEAPSAGAPTISRAACTGPRSMIPRSIAATAPWRHISGVGILPARPYHPRKTKQKLKLEHASLSSTCWAEAAQP